MKKKLAVGVATIDLTKVKMDELVTGVYPLYVPYRGSPKPTTPTSPSVTNVSPGGEIPVDIWLCSMCGRFGVTIAAFICSGIPFFNIILLKTHSHCPGTVDFVLNS